MKVAYTKIVGVESDEGSVAIKFRPQGSDSADPPVIVRVSPHETYIHLSLSNIQGRRVLAAELGGNTAGINFGKLT